MDIFTTVLTKVVSTPIKPGHLKVKALVKESATGELVEDPNHLENHDYYFSLSEKGKGKGKGNRESQEKSAGEDNAQKDEYEVLSYDATAHEILDKGTSTHEILTDESVTDESKVDDKDIKKGKTPHLDLFI